MGCAAGKQVSGSPEVSSSSHVTTTLSKEKENGWSPLVSGKMNLSDTCTCKTKKLLN